VRRMCPAAVVAVCVPWPSTSRGEKISPESMGPELRAPSTKKRAPIILSLQAVASNSGPVSQTPFQSSGGSNSTMSGMRRKRRHSQRPSRLFCAQVDSQSLGIGASRVSASAGCPGAIPESMMPMTMPSPVRPSAPRSPPSEEKSSRNSGL